MVLYSNRPYRMAPTWIPEAKKRIVHYHKKKRDTHFSVETTTKFTLSKHIINNQRQHKKRQICGFLRFTFVSKDQFYIDPIRKTKANEVSKKERGRERKIHRIFPNNFAFLWLRLNLLNVIDSFGKRTQVCYLGFALQGVANWDSERVRVKSTEKYWIAILRHE